MGEFEGEDVGGVGRCDPKRAADAGRRGGKLAFEGDVVDVWDSASFCCGYLRPSDPLLAPRFEVARGVSPRL